MIIFILTYIFFRYIVYPVLDALIFRPIMLNIIAHNQQYQYQVAAQEAAENDPCFERMVTLAIAQKRERDALLRNQQYNIDSAITNTVNIIGNSISSTTNVDAEYRRHLFSLVQDPNLTQEQHEKLREILMHFITQGHIQDYDPTAAEIGRLGLPPPPFPTGLITHKQV